MYKDPHEEIVPISPAEKAMSDVFFQIRGEAGACWFELDLSRAMAFLSRPLHIFAGRIKAPLVTGDAKICWVRRVEVIPSQKHSNPI